MKGILLFYYLGGAGGKFIANCLSYSEEVAFSDYAIALRNDPAERNQALLNTVPELSDSRTWHEREHGCWHLFGNATYGIKTNGVAEATDLNDLSLLGDRWLPIMAHHLEEVHNIQKYFKDVPVRLIIVDAVDDFIDTAIRLKWANPLACLDLDRYDEFQDEIKELAADYTFKDWDPREPDAEQRILDFASWLGIDLDLAPAQEYIKKYRAFHC
jgi:hypothetical protein